MTQQELDHLVGSLLRKNAKKLGLAGYVRLKKMLEDGRVIGPRADGMFLWRVRQKTIDSMVTKFDNQLTDVLAKRLVEDYDRINSIPVEVLFLRGMIESYAEGIENTPISYRAILTIEDIPQFSGGLKREALHGGSGDNWFENYFDFVRVPSGWLRRAKKV